MFEKQAVIQKVLNTLLFKKIGSYHYFIKHLLEKQQPTREITIRRK